jgi:hypothetical protein
MDKNMDLSPGKTGLALEESSLGKTRELMRIRLVEVLTLIKHFA